MAWAFGITVLMLCIAVAAALWWLPDWLRPRIEAAGQEALGTPVAVDRVALQLWTRSAQVQGVRIGPPNSPLLKVDALEVELAPESLWRRLPVVQRLTVKSPQLWIHRTAQGAYNFTPVLDHLQRWLAAQPPSPPNAEPARYALNNLRLTGGRIHHVDELQHQRHEVQALEIGLPFLSNLPSDVQIEVQPAVAAQVDGSALHLGGQARPFAAGQPAELKLKWTGLNLQDWAGALQAVLPADLPLALSSGLLDADLQIRFEHPQKSTTPTLQVRGSAALNRLKLGLPAQHTDLAWNSLKLEGLDLAPLQQRYTLDSVALQGLDAAYALNAPAAAAKVTSAKPVPAREAAASAPASADAAAPAPLQWRIARLSCEDCRVQVRDAQHLPATEVTLQQARLELAPLSNDLSQPIQALLTGALASGTGNQRATPGPVSLKGELRLQPLSVQAAVDLAGIDLRVAQPYLRPYVNLTLSRGALSTQGQLQLTRQAAMPGGASLLDLSYAGRLSLTDLRTLDSVTGADFVGWQTLGFQGLKVNLHRNTELAADLGHVGIDGLQARVILNPDGRLNMADIVKGSTQAAPKSITTPQTAASAAVQAASTPKAPATPPMDLRWQEVRLQRGTVAFSDHFIKPNYSARLTKLQGSISALSARAPQPAKVDIAGALDDGAPLRISGTMHPLGARLYTDIEATARGIALTRLSTYAERYAGYGIDKGSMSIKVHYKIEQGKLEADNQVFLDQLTFGQRVDSPTATPLPVLLAVSLLKNRRGEIDLHLPVAGTLDDPQFSVGGILWKMVLNILSRAATAPFALLMGGDDGEAGRIDFAAGSPELSAAARGKLDQLATQLADRPQLKLEVTGLADPARDLPPPANKVAGGASAPPPAPVAPTPAAQAALQTLADDRAARVMAYLAERLPAERILVDRSKVDAPPAEAATSAPPSGVAGVQFKLK